MDHRRFLTSCLRMAALGLGLLFAAACGLPAAEPVPITDGWRADLLAHRRQMDEEFKTSATSPLAAVDRLTLAAGDTWAVTVGDDGVQAQASAEPGDGFTVQAEAGQWLWSGDTARITCRAGGADIPPGAAIPAGALFTMGPFTFRSYPSAEQLVLLVFDGRTRLQAEFEHLLYYPPAPECVVTARLERFDHPDTVTMLTSRGEAKTYYRYARLHFRLDGRDLTLAAYTPAARPSGQEAYLFIPFKDTTNGDETYPAGRFMELPLPAGDSFTLDFNYGFNPLCNYSSAWNCPIPPPENHLAVPVRAGEKLYPH